MMTIEKALSAVMGEVQAVGKDGRNQSQGFNFRGIDAVVNAVGPALRKHGVIVLPRVLSSRYRDFNTTKGALMHEAVLEVEFTFVGPDGSTLVCSAMGESADSGDKASAKAHSVAFRTALLQALCIPTDEPDPDSHSYERHQDQGPAPATDAQRVLIAERTATLSEAQAEGLKAWWKSERIVALPRISFEEASRVIAELDRLNPPTTGEEPF